MSVERKKLSKQTLFYKEQLFCHKRCGHIPSITQMKKILETKKARKDLNDVFQNSY